MQKTAKARLVAFYTCCLQSIHSAAKEKSGKENKEDKRQIPMIQKTFKNGQKYSTAPRARK